MTPEDTSGSNDLREPLLSAAHDLRHSLFAMRTGIQLLAQVRLNETQFEELRELLEKEVQVASDRLRDLLKLTVE